MKSLTVILWLQLLLSFGGMVLALGEAHSAGMGMEWAKEMRREFEQVSRSPEYHEPPKIRGYSYSRMIETREGESRERGRTAGLAFVVCLVASLSAAALLRLFHRECRQ